VGRLLLGIAKIMTSLIDLHCKTARELRAYELVTRTE
jgi:hypothetical protein